MCLFDRTQLQFETENCGAASVWPAMTHSFRGTHTHTYIRNLCHQFHQVVSLDLRYFVRFHYYILLFEFTCVAVAIVVVVDDCAVYAAASDYKALGECSGHVRSYVAFANVNVIFSETSR